MPDGVAYDEDFLLWTQEQARLLRAERTRRSNVAIDWENVAEEIESLGKSQLRELESRLARILEHLLKLSASATGSPRNGWIDTVEEQQREVALLLKQNPSLRQKVLHVVEELSSDVRESTALKLARYGEVDAADQLRSGAYPEVEARVLDPSFIPHPPAGTTST